MGKRTSFKSSNLRQKAEEQLNNWQLKVKSPLFETDILKLHHELQVYQIELEMQQEELIAAKQSSDIECRKYTELYDFAPSGYFTLSTEGKIIELNLKGAGMLGKERQRLINSRFSLFITSDTKQTFDLFLQKVFKIKKQESCEVFISNNGNNEASCVFITGHVTENEDICSITIVDITDRKQAEIKVKESELRYRSLIENSTDAIFCVDEKGQYQFTNQLFASTFGKTPEYFAGKSFWDIYPKEHADFRYEAVKRVFQTGKSESFEVDVPLPDKTLYFWATCNPIKDESGKVTLMLTHSADITQRKRSEEELKKRMDELTALNKELGKFSNANKELEQFAYVASHNLQEPLRTVSNYAKIFEEDYSDQIDERALKYLHIINDATKRMTVLLRSLLEFSRLGRNMKLSAVDCKQLINEVISDLNNMIVTSKASIIVGEMPLINLYEAEIRQLFQNLIVNGIKFGKKDTLPEIQIISERLPDKWKFSVSDNGIGIAPEYFNRIFDIFQRLHNNSEYEGSGIGLAYCKKIIQLHRGEIWVESTLGKGTTFYFTIPDLVAWKKN